MPTIRNAAASTVALTAVFSLGLVALAATAFPATAQSIYQEQGKLIRAPQAVGARRRPVRRPRQFLYRQP
jgi:hypothetical protein